MANEDPQYHSYLLRLWQDDDQAGLSPDSKAVPIKKDVWRASLQSATSGRRHSFSSMEGLYTFLKRRTQAAHGGTGQGSDLRTVQMAGPGPPSETE